MSHSLALSLASWEGKGYVDLPSQSTASRPLALFAWIEEAEKSTNYMSWWSSRSSNGLYWSCTISNSPYEGIIEHQEIRKVGLSETHASETEKPALTMIDEKPTDGTNTSKKDQDGTWNDGVWEFLRGSIHTLTEPRRRIEVFFVKMVMEWWMLIFSRQSFFKQVFKVSYACSSNHRVCDRVCTHTHLLQRTFFCTKRVHSHIRTSSCVCTYTHGPSVWKGLLHVHVVDLHLAFSVSCLTHLCCLRTTTLSFSTFPSAQSLPNLPVLKAQDMRISARAPKSLATWPSPVSTQVMSPKSSTRSFL